MTPPRAAFVQIVEEILRRYSIQNGRAADSACAIEFAARLWVIVQERGLPPPLADGELGRPGELPDEICVPLVTRVLGEVTEFDRDFFATPVRQLVKACFHEEFKTCRDTFRAVSPDGKCRRQELSRARQRVSGTHCIDCPYWVSFTSEEHGKFLEKEWQNSDRSVFVSHREIFLPEDFRALRRYLHHTARSSRI